MSTFVRLLAVVGPDRRWVALAALLAFLTIMSSVALMATSAYLISRAALVTEVATLSIAITGVRLFAILRATFRYLERLVSHHAALRVLAHMRVWFYAAVEPLAPSGVTRYRSGDLLARSVADVETLEGFYVRVVAPTVAAGLVVATVSAWLGAFELSLGLVVFSFLLVAGVVLPLVTHWLGRRPSAEIVARRAELQAVLVDEVQGMREMLVFDYRGTRRTRMLALSRALSEAQARMALLRGAGNALGTLAGTLAALTVLTLGIALVGHGGVAPVYLAALPLATMASFEAVQPLSLALSQLEANHEAGRRIFELVDASPPVREPEGAMAPMRDVGIEAREVRLRYRPGDELALDGVGFSVPPGARIAIVGPNGAGKSTIVNLLLRFWDYEAGTITLGGRDLREYRSDDVRALIGVVPQTIHLFNATVRDNLLLADPDATDDQIVAACRQACLHEFIERLPQRYDTMIGENGVRLSGGERQRLAIARVILKNTPIVVLDEPTANLDAVTERDLMQSLEPFLAGRSVSIISHRRVAIERAVQVIVLDRGRVLNQALAV